MAPTRRHNHKGRLSAPNNMTVDFTKMGEFSKLAQRQAGVAKVWKVVGGLALAGAAIFGVAAFEHHQRELELFDQLKATAAAMKAESSAIAGVRSYFAQEAERIEKYHRKNQELLDKDPQLDQWLSAIDGAPTASQLRQEEAARFEAAKQRLAREREGAEQVWMALSAPQDFERLKSGLSRENLEKYSLVKACAARAAGEGVYCGEVAAVGARVSALLRQAGQLREASEAQARESLAGGWSGWDGAEAGLLESSFKEIDAEQAKAKASFDSGQLDKEDWASMQAGFAASKTAAVEQIHADRVQLEAKAHSGSLSGFDWYLLGYMMRSTPSSAMVQAPGLASSSQAAPYMRGGGAYRAPDCDRRDAPCASGARSSSSGASGFVARSGGSAGQRSTGVAGSTASAAAPMGSSSTPALKAGSSEPVAAPKMAANPVASEPLAVAKAPASPVGVKATLNPYSATAARSHLGAKLGATFDAAAGRVSPGVARGGMASHGLAGKAAAYSASRSAARASVARAAAAARASAAHASSHASAGHGGGGHGGGG